MVVHIKPQQCSSDRGAVVEGRTGMGGLLQRRGLINHICSGDVSLVPVLKRDREVRGKRVDKGEEKRGGKLRLRLVALPLLPFLSMSLCVLLPLYRQKAIAASFKVYP